MPIRWEQEWPIVGADGKCHLEEDGPLPAAEIVNCEREWMTLRSANVANIQRNGKHIMLCASEDILSKDLGTPAMILTRQQDFEDSLWCDMHFEPLQDGDMAGMVVYLSHQFYYRMGIKREGGVNYVLVEKVAEDFRQVAYQREIGSGDISMGIKAEKTCYHFYVLEDGGAKELCSASARFLCCEFAGKCFTGTLWGFFAESPKDSGVNVDFCIDFELPK